MSQQYSYDYRTGAPSSNNKQANSNLMASDIVLINAINTAGSRLILDNSAATNATTTSNTKQNVAASSIYGGGTSIGGGSVIGGGGGGTGGSVYLNTSVAASMTPGAGGGGGSTSGGGGVNNSTSGNVLSEVEAAILRSTVPIDVNETEEITVNGERGIWANKHESINFRGVIPISHYTINDDPNPEIIRKKTDQKLVYQQEVAIRYLRPPTPPPPGEILIQQEPNILTPPAPPLVIRQQPPRPTTPPPLVVREAPPPPPPAVGRKVITISGKRIPPPPRKVIIERLPPLPSKPQSVIIERWLPYRQIKRRVIYAKSTSNLSGANNNNKDGSGNGSAVMVKPKNIIIQWEPPRVHIKKEFKDLGIVRANPVEYVQRYGSSLKRSIELPSFVKEIKPPDGVVLAAESGHSTLYELEGDVYALNLVDLEREGLVEYRYLLKQVSGGLGNPGTIVQTSTGATVVEATITSNSRANSDYHPANATSTTSIGHASQGSVSSGASTSAELINELFKTLNLDSNNTISVGEAELLLKRLNSRLGKRFESDESKQFFDTVEINPHGRIDVNYFRKVFEQHLSV